MILERAMRPIAALVATFALLAGCDRFTSVDTRMARATTQLEAGEFQAALIDLRKVLDEQPENLDAQLLLVDVLSRSGETPTALVQLDRAIAAGATPAATEPRRLALLLASGDHEALRTALTSSTTLPPAQRATLEGQLLLLEKQPADAAAAFERAMAADPTLADAALGRIEALVAQNHAKDAQQAIDALLQRDPKLGRAWLFKGSLAARAGDFTAANEALAKAIENSRGMSREQRLLAHVGQVDNLLTVGDLESARKALEDLKDVAGESPIALLMHARIALADQDATTAVNELRKFIQAAPQHLPGRLLLVSALLEQGSVEQAFAEAVRSVSEFPDQDQPRLVLASVQLNMGRTADAEDTLQPLATQSPPNPLATAMIADIRVRNGEAAAGISLLEQGLAENPQNSRLKLQLALAQLSAGDAKRATQILDSIQDSSVAAARDRLHVIAAAALQGTAAVSAELDAAIKRHPKDVDLQLMAAAYAANTGQTDQARGLLRHALELRPGDPTLAMPLARLELSAGRATEAEALAKSVLDKSPNDSTGMVLMATIAAQRGQETDVDAWLNRARVANPSALDVSLALARRAAVRGDAVQARSILAETVRQTPRNPGARVALAELIASQGNHAEALSELREAARLNPDSALIPLSAAKVQLAASNTAAARTSLQQALNLDPGWLPAATLLASLEVSTGNFAKALEVVRDVRRANPDGNAADLLEGDIQLAAKRPVLAAKVFATAYRRRPGSAAAIRTLQAKALSKLDAPDAELMDWVTRTPTDSGARRALADYYLNNGRNDAAIEQLQHVVAARPTDAIALNNLAWLYHQKSDSRALATAERAYTAAPKLAAVADTYGWILVNSGRTEEGVKILAQAAQLAPNEAQIQIHFAHALAQTGQKQPAIALLRRLLSSSSPPESMALARKLLASLE